MASIDSDEGMNILLGHFEGVLQGQGALNDSEAALNDLRTQPGFGVALAKLTLAPAVPLPARQFASVLLKQFVDKYWNASDLDVNGFIIPDGDKDVLKDNMAIGLTDHIRSIRIATAYVVSRMAFYDWPEQWPNLFENLIENLQQGDPNTVHGTLRCLSEFSKDMSGSHMPSAIPVLFPELARILENSAGSYNLRDQMRSINIFTTCIKCVYMMLGQYENESIDLVAPYLPDWIERFASILSDTNIGAGMDCGLKIEALKSLTLLVRGFAKYMNKLLEPVFPNVWSILVAGQQVYEALVWSDEAAEYAQDSDGDALGFEFMVTSIFDFISACVREKRYRKVIKETLGDLLPVLVFYMQATGDQLELWSNDPDQYLQDEDEEITKSHSVRIAAVDLVDALVCLVSVKPIFYKAAVEAGVNAVVARIEESQAQKEAGNEAFWRIREAAFFTFGRISDEVISLCEDEEMQFDLEGFLSSILLPDLQSDGNPFFLGRALWLASFFAHKVPEELSGAFLEAAVSGIGPENPVAIRICASQALTQFCPRLPKETMVSAVEPIVAGIIELAKSWPSESVIILALSVLVHVTKVNDEATAALEHQLVPLVIALWLEYPTSHRIAADILDLIDVLCDNQQLYPDMVRRFIPTLVSVLEADEAAVPVPGFKACAIDIIATMIDKAPEPFPDAFLSDVFPVVCTQVMDSADAKVMQSGSEILRSYVRRANVKLAEPFTEDGTTGVDYILQIVEKILSVEQSEDASTFIGGLIVGLIRHLGNAVGDSLPPMLTACVQRLATAQFTIFIQSLVMVFAQLVNMQSPSTVLDFLESCEIECEYHPIQLLLATWVRYEEDFMVDYEIKVSIVALTKFLIPPDDRIADMPVDGYRVVDVNAPILLRSGGEARNEFTSVPFPVKIFMLLLNHLRDAMEQGVEEEDTSDEGEDSLAALGLPGIGGGRGGAKYIDLSDMVGMGLEFDDDDDDPDAKDDPINEYNIMEYVTAFFKQFASQSEGTFREIASQLNEADQEFLQAVLEGRLDA